MARDKNAGRSKAARYWVLKTAVITFFLAIGMSLIGETVLQRLSIPVAVFVLLLIIGVGILFDIIGIAITATTEAPLSAMASRRIRGAKQAVRLVKNADIMANFCNDVVGDICGIVSGAAGAAISGRLILGADSTTALIVGIVISALIAVMTVSGKAMGKRVAMRYSADIVLATGKVMSVFARRG